MGKHETGYARADHDFYPTRQRWITEALLGHIGIGGRIVLEPAAGEGDIAEVLKAAGATVYWAERASCTNDSSKPACAT
jgi:hypothetical protein